MSSDGEVLLTDEQRQELVSLSSVSSVEKYIKKLSVWQSDTGKRCKDPFSTIRKWITEDKEKEKPKERSYAPSYDIDEFEQFALNFSLSGGQGNGSENGKG